MVIDGKKIAQKILADVQQRVERLSFRPLFCDVLVGDDPVSLSYVTIKGRTASQVGMDFHLAQFPASISQSELVLEIKKLALMPHMCGLIVQLPLPAAIDRQVVLDAVDARIDVDCMSNANKTAFYSSENNLLPPTAAAIMEILQGLPKENLAKTYLVVGQGELVGKPVSFLLSQKGYEVVTADRSVDNLSTLALSAGVIISATGKPGLITGAMITPGSVVIDAGTAESEGGIVGDVDFESVEQKAGFISPVPGGVGPVTVAKLLENVVKVAEML